MKKFLLLVLLPLLIFYYHSDANHMIGGEITYKHIDKLKYEITYKFYRDCRGIPFNTPNVSIYGSSTPATKSLNKSLTMVRDVSNHCKKINNPCSPQNQTVTLSTPAVEEHVYIGYVDFNNADSAFKKYCNIVIGAGQCCRPGSITTGLGSTDYWVTCEINICEAPGNSSPILTSLPNNILCCNQPVFLNLGAIDKVENDSLSYSFGDPLESFTSKANYNSGFSSSNPFNTYYPSGYNKAKGPDPNANPPIGIYLDPIGGSIIFTPVDCNEITVMMIKITEWRKNSKGTYVKIGTISRDLVFFVITCTDNNPPTIKGNTKMSVCSGQKLCYDISTDDKQYKTNPLDTVSLTWNGGIPKASFQIKDTTARLKVGQFCWSTTKADASNLPYTYTATVRDNICPMNGIAIWQFSVMVKPTIEATWTKSFITNGLYELKIDIKSGGSKSDKYVIAALDSVGKPLDTLADFSSTGTDKSTKLLDSIQFYRGGKYLIQISLNNSSNCPVIYYDTIQVDSVAPILSVSGGSAAEKWLCRGSYDSIYPIIRNAKKPLRYRWSTSLSDTLSYLKFKVTKDTTIRVIVYDFAGCKRYTTWTYKVLKTPLVTAFNDTLICANDSVTLKAKVFSFSEPIHWKWTLKGKTISTTPNPKVSKPGVYKLEITDSTNCPAVSDSMEIKNWVVTANAGVDVEQCKNDTVYFTAKGLDTTAGKTGNYKWYTDQVRSVPSATGEKIKFNIIRSGQMILLLTQSNGKMQCSDLDTVKYILQTQPTLQLKDIEVCQDIKELDIHSLILNPAYTKLGKITFTLIKTLNNPQGSPNKLEDLILDKDTSIFNDYYLKVGKSSIDLGTKNSDTLKLRISFIDELGCKSINTPSMSVIIKPNIAISFKNQTIDKCFGDSIPFISNEFIASHSGGKWYTFNDSSAYESWPQGNKVQLAEKLKTSSLNSKGGKYLLSYDNTINTCNSRALAQLTVHTFPVINWSQTEKGDSLLLKETSSNAIKREWFVNSNKVSEKSEIIIAKSRVKVDVIKLRTSNAACVKDSIITPKTTWGIKAIPSDFISISPNPAQNHLLIKSNLAPPLELKITNQLGQTIFTQMLMKTEESIDISKWSKGIYFIEVKANENVGRVKFVKE